VTESDVVLGNYRNRAIQSEYAHWTHTRLVA
jgi:hypothetical protein